MLKNEERSHIVSFLQSLQTRQGGFQNSLNEPMLPQATLSVLKVLEYFGHSPKRLEDIFAYIMSLHDAKTGGFIDPISGKLSVFSTAGCILILHQIGETTFFHQSVTKSLSYMSEHATSREEHFMLIGVVDECKLSYEPQSSILFFRQMEEEEGGFGHSVLNNAIAASALIRAKASLKNPEKVKILLLSGQEKNGGFVDVAGKANLWTTYCVMRALDLFQIRPNVTTLSKWIKSMYNKNGFALPGKEADANTTYQCLSVLNWIADPIFCATKNGDISTIKAWLEVGGDPDVTNLEGWTLLMAASVRGQSKIVEFLLSDDIPGGRQADPSLRLESADATALFWVGQAGDLETAKILLRYKPEQIFDISKINGHNILLQAAFFGSERHLELAKWILEQVGEILSISKENHKEIEEARLKLTRATNVRGYNGLTMSRLWGNKEMEQLFEKFDKSTVEDRTNYLQALLSSISVRTTFEGENPFKQQLTDRIIQEITDGFAKMNSDSVENRESMKQHLLNNMNEILFHPEFDINRLGGPLNETPIISAITGVDRLQEIADFRLQIVTMLLVHGADPDIPEKHPMGVDAIIRAAVLNHFNILKRISQYMGPRAFQAALNEKPVINGQTALQDTVHRALTASEDKLQSHLDQITWCISKGARYDIEDHTGTSPEKLAINALQDSVFKERAIVVMKALGIANLLIAY